MTGLVPFLLARIAEDERRQNGKNGDEDWHEFQCDIHRLHPETKVRYGCDCGVPARVLAECEAKRRITEWVTRAQRYAAEGQPGAFDSEDARALTHALRLLALPYADHPDYREEWRP